MIDSKIDLKTLGTGGAVTALEFTFNFQHIYRSYKLRRKDVKCLTQ